MRLDALKHMARAIVSAAETERLVVFGSASFLATWPELGDDRGGPLDKTYDADFIPEPFDEEMGLMLDESFGKERKFHQIFGYCADIIRPIALEQFPEDWEERLVPLEGVGRVFCLEPHDAAAAKCQAGRPKDVALLGHLIGRGLLDARLVTERLQKVAMREAMIVKAHRALDEAARESGLPEGWNR